MLRAVSFVLSSLRLPHARRERPSRTAAIKAQTQPWNRLDGTALFAHLSPNVYQSNSLSTFLPVKPQRERPLYQYVPHKNTCRAHGAPKVNRLAEEAGVRSTSVRREGVDSRITAATVALRGGIRQPVRLQQRCARQGLRSSAMSTGRQEQARVSFRFFTVPPRVPEDRRRPGSEALPLSRDPLVLGGRFFLPRLCPLLDRRRRPRHQHLSHPKQTGFVTQAGRARRKRGENDASNTTFVRGGKNTQHPM